MKNYRVCCMVVAALLSCLPSGHGWAADSNAGGAGKKLRLALAGAEQVPAASQSSVPVTTPEDLCGRVVRTYPEWFEWVPATQEHDVTATIKRKGETTSLIEQWRIQLELQGDLKKTLGKGDDRVFPGLPAIEPWLARELQRLHTIVNLASVSDDRIKVKLSLEGQAKDLYVKGDSFRYKFEAPVDGFLNLISVDPSGKIRRLFPTSLQRESDEDNRVSASTPLLIPRKPYSYRVSEPPYGQEFVKAIFSTTPLDLSFLDKAGTRGLDGVSGAITRDVSSGESKMGTSQVHFNTTEK